MKQYLTFVMVTMLFVTSALAQSGATETARDESTIREIPQKIAAAWNTGSGSRIAAVYADDGTLVAGDGKLTQGRSQIARYHDEQFAAFLKGTRLSVQVKSVRFLSPGVALMRTEGGILWPGQSELAPGNQGIQSFVVVKDNGVWRVTLFQNTRIRA